jgi:transposase
MRYNQSLPSKNFSSKNVPHLTEKRYIIRWLDEIIAYFDNRTTSGVVEGINNKLKLIKRSAYGL